MGRCPYERRLTTANFFSLDQSQPNILARSRHAALMVPELFSLMFLFETETVRSLTQLHVHDVDYICLPRSCW